MDKFLSQQKWIVRFLIIAAIFILCDQFCNYIEKWGYKNCQWVNMDNIPYTQGIYLVVSVLFVLKCFDILGFGSIKSRSILTCFKTK